MHLKLDTRYRGSLQTGNHTVRDFCCPYLCNEYEKGKGRKREKESAKRDKPPKGFKDETHRTE